MKYKLFRLLEFFGLAEIEAGYTRSPEYDWIESTYYGTIFGKTVVIGKGRIYA